MNVLVKILYTTSLSYTTIWKEQRSDFRIEREFYCSRVDIPENPSWQYRELQRRALRKGEKKGIPSWCSIYTSNPTVVCVFVVELPPATKARQPRSIRSLCVWLHTSQLGRWYYINAGCFQKICRLYAGQRWNTSGFETEKNKEGGSVSHHSTYSNDTLTPAGWNEWKCESAILTHAPLFPCFRTDQLWRRCRKCLWLPETAD